MEAGPPALIETVVRLLIPPAGREHVMGDLWERYSSPRQYTLEALRTIPFVVASRIRRTISVPGLAIQGFVILAVFPARPDTWFMTVIPTLAALAALVLRDAYRTLMPRWPREAALDAVAAAACGLTAQGLLLFLRPDLLPSGDTSSHLRPC